MIGIIEVDFSFRFMLYSGDSVIVREMKFIYNRSLFFFHLLAFMPKSSRRSRLYDLPQIINMASSKVLLEMKYAKPEDDASQLTIKKNELYSEGQFSDLKKTCKIYL